ncbi:LacI family DNA-binding transcriptional regulator [Phytohabitans houttuyneae]|uniref:LacI family transcriptional regulator n=2 Tax=Phytohabitans houttuyneae TaxID=1076126 RepID=A0A6V8KBP3_9ACTN|nr:LacI family transcriptional regulator [Phytohabitans houttuyneae]
MEDEREARPVDRTPSGSVPVLAVDERPRSVIMRDVARHAGVSHQTVSRVLNGHPRVRPETRQRVLAAMQALDYRRNLAARTLVTRRSGILGVIGVETTLFGPASMLFGIEEAARAAGYLVTVANVRTVERQVVHGAVDRLCQHAVEGIIAVAPKPALLDAIAAVLTGPPAVGVGGGVDGAVPTVRVDNLAGARLATQHLLTLGHATVHHVAGPFDWPEARERIVGWRSALLDAGAPVPVIRPGSWSAGSGYERGQRLARNPSVTAVFCANDQIALGVLRALHEAGRRVPEDVSVVGFDDTPDSGYFLPPLTTVRQDFAELGRHSLAMLLDRLDGVPPVAHVQLPPALVVRASTAWVS